MESSSTTVHFGKTITPDLANYNGNSTYSSGPQGKGRGGTTPVDHFKVANAFGLYDMHGNVWEWCADHWHNSYEGAPDDETIWSSNGKSSCRVVRGGSWLVGNPGNCRSASRNSSLDINAVNELGFRVVCSAPRLS